MRGMLLSVMVAFACGLMAMPAKAETRTAPMQAVGPGKDCAECPEMVRIPGRSFMAGKHEVTFAEWDACVAGGGCNGYRPEDRGWGRGRRPVTNVSWNDAQAYVQWLSNKTGKRYRLLTSEEWEFAARAGTTTEYSWGNEEPACNESARNGANFAACPDNRTRPVGSFPANGFGLHDVHGNVEEWVEDCDDGDCSRRVLRGGTWVSSPQSLRSAIRSRSDPSISDNFMGFRVARTL
jgi:formylglycine-generating enzyme required for sulfatase activity